MARAMAMDHTLPHDKLQVGPAFGRFNAFGRKVFEDGALPAKMKQIIAAAVSHVTQCPYCIKSHTKAALRAGATSQELMEAVWVAAEMWAGGAYAHSTLMLSTMEEEQAKRLAPSSR